jgi:hypothetical protein
MTRRRLSPDQGGRRPVKPRGGMRASARVRLRRRAGRGDCPVPTDSTRVQDALRVASISSSTVLN